MSFDQRISGLSFSDTAPDYQRKHRRNVGQRKYKRTEKREDHGQCHRHEHLALDTAKAKDRQVNYPDDRDREYYGPRDLKARF